MRCTLAGDTDKRALQSLTGDRSRESTILAIPYPKAHDGLKKCTLFHHMASREIDGLLRKMECQHYRVGQVVKASGDEAAGVEVVITGMLEIRREAFVPRRVGPGGYHGGETVFNSEASYHEVVAIAETDILRATRHDLMVVMRSDPKVATKLLFALGQDLLADLERAHERLAASSPEKGEQRS